MAEHCKISAALVSVSEERSYVLKLDGYSRAKGLLKSGEFLVSTPFSVGGHIWAVKYYPNGNFVDFISLYLLHVSVNAEAVTAKFRVSVLDKNGEPVPSFSSTATVHTFTRWQPDWGYTSFLKKADLEGSEHLREDCLTIRCDVTIVKEIQSEEITVDQLVMFTPSDLHRHLGDLLQNKDAADLTFQVGGQRFSAHRCVLAARSSVFKAELIGEMKGNSPDSPIEIRDMEADVFKSLLHFIYTDSVPPALESASNKGGDVVMAGHLLVAADRYDIRRLKQICEQKLCNHIDSEMVATTLALAEQHDFRSLKEACLKFLASPSKFKAMMASDGFEHLKSSCPSVLKELIAKMLPAELKDIVMAVW